MRDLMYENSGFFQWGLQLFNGDPINSGYHDCNHLENDEVIARTLQDDFSQLTVSETSGYSHVVEDHYQASNLEHDWHGPSTMNYHCSDYNHGQEETDDAEPSTSCSSPGDREEYPYSPELTEEYLLDQMIPTPHVPRINGEIPSSDEATSDHQRLLERLQTYDFVERTIQGDGNCQFRALSDQLYQTPDNHKLVRQQVVSQLRSHPEAYEGYVPMQYEDYLERMSESGEWGDHVTLQAAADSFGVKIFVVTSFKDTCCIEILPNFQKPKRVIFLSFWAEVHYNSINPRGGLPSNESRKRKKWWIFGNKN
ncbi:hypothetical protein RGQ29_026116 [Quercus rubra]|uniref:ubiquitinyl hydrolase 1 n=1 Tax=Quercus rubra TaxID=3512 RepID=A0AAN7EZZ9_QUERU|nr:hypothetical protein RGQ29_026116 [Quercus rubra]KAK4583197.1 hypothetical protein RGQ29_026116 [Quercus rubra]KAK4583198.1 hypothetical protein RGQ29_026116 [Quercus rubra]